jgi:hypothetical protein
MVTILCGSIVVDKLPRHVLASISTLPDFLDVSKHEIRLPGYIAIMHVHHLLVWLQKYFDGDGTRVVEAFKNVRDDLCLLRASRLLGLEQFVAHIDRFYVWRLRHLHDHPLTISGVQAVVELAASADDKYLRLLAEEMVDSLRQGKVRFPGRVWAYIRAHDDLHTTVKEMGGVH